MVIAGIGGAVGGVEVELELTLVLVLISCFSHPLTTNLATHSYLIDQLANSLLDLIHQLGGQAWAPHHQDLTPQSLHRAHQLGLIANAWTVNKHINHLSYTPIDGAITDYPRSSG